MYKQYFKQAFASLRENPLVSFLTILGTALSVAMMIVLILVYQIKTSSFSPVSARHRILYVNTIEGLNNQNSGFRGGGLGSRIVRECFYPMNTPEVVTAISSHVFPKRLSAQGIKLVRQCDIREVDANFWKVFDFQFLSGSPFTEYMFNSAAQVAVINDKIAREFFGITDVVGQTIQLDFVDYTIQGVIRSVSEAVNEVYGEIWTPYSLNRNIMNNDMVEGIGGQLHVCILAKSVTDFDAIRQETHNRIATFNSGQNEYFANIWKQPITSIQKMFYFVQGDRMHGNFSGMISLAALFLFLPVFNLLGIVFSQIQKRRPEIGLRKAFGATSFTVVRQILVENLIITLIGSVIGLSLSFLFLYIAKDGLFERPDTVLKLNMLFKPTLFFAALFVCLVINLLSAGFPAWISARAEVSESLNMNT